MKKLIYILCFVLVAINTWGATYYVSTIGSNTSPYDTWAKAMTDQTTLNGIDMDTGSVVNFRAGDTFPGSNGSVTLAGITGAGKTITLQGLTTGDATPTAGQEPIFDADSSSNLNDNIHITNTAITTLNIYNVQFAGQNIGYYNAYMYLEDMTNVNIENCNANGYGGETYTNNTQTYWLWLEDFKATGTANISESHVQNLGPSTIPADGYSDSYAIYIGDSLPSGVINIFNTEIHDINADALQTRSSDATLTIYNNQWYNCGEQPIDLKHSKNVTIRNNRFYRDADFTGPGGVPGGTVGTLITVQIVNENDYDNDWNSDDILIEKNYIGNNQSGDGVSLVGSLYVNAQCTASNTPHKCCDGESTGTCDDGFNMTNVVIQENWFEENDNGTYFQGVDTQGVLVLNNVFLNHSSPAIYENLNPTSGQLFYGNTIVNTTIPDDIDADEGVIYLPYSKSTFRNNVIVSNGTDYLLYASGSGSPTVNNNLWHNTTSGTQNIIYFSGTIYDESELTTGDNWQGSHAGSMFELADFNNLSSHEFWPITSESNLIGAGVDLGVNYDDLIEHSGTTFITDPPVVSTMLQPTVWTIGAYGYEGIDAPPVDHGKTTFKRGEILRGTIK